MYHPPERIPERPTDATLRRRQQHARKRLVDFLRGPIPLPWLAKAALVPGKSPLVVALLLWFRAGASKRRDEIRLPRSLLERFGLSRRTTYNSLQALEAVGLIHVDRHRGRNPRVQILDVEPHRLVPFEPVETPS